ncbi:MAG: hypothetical protein ACI8VC_002186 [Candidatus Endobugula sp.]|jgi:hypothetical protein
MLGHSQLSNTEIYTHVAIHKIKEEHNLTHPASLPDNEPQTEQDLFAVLDEEADEEADEENLH